MLYLPSAAMQSVSDRSNSPGSLGDLPTNSNLHIEFSNYKGEQTKVAMKSRNSKMDSSVSAPNVTERLLHFGKVYDAKRTRL